MYFNFTSNTDCIKAVKLFNHPITQVHIMPLVIDSLRGGHTQYAHAHIPISWTKAIIRS